MEFVDKTNTITILPYAKLVSFDVISKFSSIPCTKCSPFTQSVLEEKFTFFFCKTLMTLPKIYADPNHFL